jgi:hypothetical protein
MPHTTVLLLDIIDSNSLHGPVRELHQDNDISYQIKSNNLPAKTYYTRPRRLRWKQLTIVSWLGVRATRVAVATSAPRTLVATGRGNLGT